MSAPDAYRSLSLKIEHWPRACSDGWEQALREPGLFEAVRPASKWRSATERKTRKGFGIYLHWLRTQGCLEMGASPSDLVSLSRAKAYHLALVAIGRAPLTLYSRLQELHFAMRVLAPGTDWTWLGEVVQRLRKGARPSRPKLARLQRADKLERLGLTLIARAEAEVGRTLYKRALMYRDGLMIALLIHRPLRLKNFAALAIGTSLVLEADRGFLVFPGEDMKGKRPLDLPFPAVLWGPLQTYLNVYRPHLLTLHQVEAAGQVDALWISNEGRAVVEGAIHVAIKKRTKAAFGLDLCPHLFRDCAVTTVVRHAPASARLTRDLLGHATLDVTNKHYNQAQMVETSRRHMAMMEQLMGGVTEPDVGGADRDIGRP